MALEIFITVQELTLFDSPCICKLAELYGCFT